jgi:hypothetical protein
MFILGVVSISGAEAVAIQKQSKENDSRNIETMQAGNIVDLGKMTILDKKCKIELKYDNYVPIEDCSPYETYAFVMQYYMHETNICQEKWIFRMTMQVGTMGEAFIVDEEIIEDDWLLTDEADGELWIELAGHELWESREYNYITIDCMLYSDILWLTNYSLVDESHEMTQVTVQNYLSPQLTWNTMDGTDWGNVRVNGDPENKRFILKNTGDWVAENINFNLIGYEAFTIIKGEEIFNLEPNEQHMITVRFNPSSTGEKTAFLRAQDQGLIFISEELTLKGIGRGITPKDNINLVLFKNLERFPILERLLMHLFA